MRSMRPQKKSSGRNLRTRVPGPLIRSLAEEFDGPGAPVGRAIRRDSRFPIRGNGSVACLSFRFREGAQFRPQFGVFMLQRGQALA